MVESKEPAVVKARVAQNFPPRFAPTPKRNADHGVIGLRPMTNLIPRILTLLGLKLQGGQRKPVALSQKYRI
ncbi:Dihydroxyacetone kinase [Fusarium oxysporum f. sp. albedinis]|nr:Dihydroxyacetone kinase [Fusarium oxysporum f. sp. albedinis]